MKFITLIALVATILAQTELEKKQREKVCDDLCAKLETAGTCFPETDVKNVQNCPAHAKYFMRCDCANGGPHYWWDEENDDNHWCASGGAGSKCYMRGDKGGVKNKAGPSAVKPGGNKDAAPTTVNPICEDLCRSDTDSCFPETDVDKVKTCPAGAKAGAKFNRCDCADGPRYWWEAQNDESHWCASGEDSDSPCFWCGVNPTIHDPSAVKPDGNKEGSAAEAEGSAGEEEGSDTYVIVIGVMAIVLLAIIALACYFNAKRRSPRQTAEDAAGAAASSSFATRKHIGVKHKTQKSLRKE
eukprot:GEMP01033053.1.p2 GENE.GEMP01033053.1~~GEMP01033053.1.p2  ORF type:complete len:299 (-),score=70.32 GEMP01033053.1:1123-2019(-)